MSFRLCFLGLLSTCLLATSCSKQKENMANESLAGEWEWVKTDGGIANHIHETPASTGKKVELRLRADNQYSITTNGVVTSQGTYTLIRRTCIHDHLDKTVIDFSTDQDLMVEEISKSTLALSDEAYDGLGSLYSRKKTIRN
jgi:hypothetical protein